ncbi:MAG: hypothetical protein JO040_13360 [Gemmatimonadetes bacterium]|nr:hypothetical protein [Gemmatimonadota bacterium]
MNFPLQLSFKKIALSPQISVTDAAGQLQLYVKQKAFKLKEAVTVFADAEQTRPLYRMAADRVIDISAQYHIAEEGGRELGTLQRKGMRSLWRAHYEISRDGGTVMQIREENPWVKVIDGLVGEIPIVGIFSGYMFNPAYIVSRSDTGTPVLRIKKQPALLEGRFSVEKLGDLSDGDEKLAVLGLLMMTLLERSRG